MKILGREFRPKSLIENPSEESLREWSLKKGGLITQFGNLGVVTDVRNRLAKFTETILGKATIADVKSINEVLDFLETKDMLCLDRTISKSPNFKIPCRVYVTADYPRILLMWGNTLFPSEGKEPEFSTITVPEWPEKKVLVFPDEGLTFILGSDYKGENKKSMLRQLMYRAKREGNLGLHAGSKILKIKKKGELTDLGCLFFGLSGTGKTSLTCHSHWLKFPETAIIRQDDVVILTPKAEAIGTEDSFYIKTDGLEPKTQPLIYAAAISPKSILENVKVDRKTYEVDFFDRSLTSNGRAMVKRSDVAFTDQEIDLEKVHLIFFITRRYNIVPPITRLSPEWAAAAFMLGESIETSAGDPTQAGKSLHVVGANPFIVGSHAEEGNIFLKILKKNPIQCFVLNTGKVGGIEGQDITLNDTLKMIEMAARDKISWKSDSFWGYEVPKHIPDIDMERFNLKRFYSEEKIKELSYRLKKERLEWLSEFPELNSDIINVLN